MPNFQENLPAEVEEYLGHSLPELPLSGPAISFYQNSLLRDPYGVISLSDCYQAIHDSITQLPALARHHVTSDMYSRLEFAAAAHLNLELIGDSRRAREPEKWQKVNDNWKKRKAEWEKRKESTKE